MINSDLEQLEKEFDTFMEWVTTDDKSFVSRANCILFANHMRKAIKDRDAALAELKKIKKQLEITIAESDRFEQMLYREAGISYTLMEELEQYKRDAERYRFIRGKFGFSFGRVSLQSGYWSESDIEQLAIKTDANIDLAISQQHVEGEL